MYYHISRACIGCRTILDSPELATVQVVMLAASYHGMTGEHYTMDSTVRLLVAISFEKNPHPT